MVGVDDGFERRGLRLHGVAEPAKASSVAPTAASAPPQVSLGGGD
jgi:hypothetical protein